MSSLDLDGDRDAVRPNRYTAIDLGGGLVLFVLNEHVDDETTATLVRQCRAIVAGGRHE